MKFQDSSFNGLKVTVGTKSVTHPLTHAPKAICPINFFKVGGITTNPKQPRSGLIVLKDQLDWGLLLFKTVSAFLRKNYNNFDRTSLSKW